MTGLFTTRDAWGAEPVKGVLVDVVTRERLEFQYNPNDITDQKDTTYGTATIPGMSHPRYQFVAGGARKVGFSVSFYTFDNTVKARCDWLRSLLYPERAGSMLKNAPHRILFLFGQLYTGDSQWVMRDVKIHYSTLFDPKTLLPRRADVELLLEEFAEGSINASDVRTKGR